MADKLILFIGNTTPFDIVIGVTLDGSDHASFTMLDRVGGNTILQRDTTEGNLSINKPDKKLTATLSGAESDALIAATYIAQAGVRFGDGDSWKFSEPFHVEVKASAVTKVP